MQVSTTKIWWNTLARTYSQHGLQLLHQQISTHNTLQFQAVLYIDIQLLFSATAAYIQ